MRRLTNGFFKKSLLSTSLEVPWIMAEMAQTEFKHFDTASQLQDPMAYEQAVFLTSKFGRFAQISEGLKGAEREEFDRGVERLQRFADFRDFLAYCADVHRTVSHTYLKLSSDISNSKVLMSREVF